MACFTSWGKAEVIVFTYYLYFNDLRLDILNQTPFYRPSGAIFKGVGLKDSLFFFKNFIEKFADLNNNI